MTKEKIYKTEADFKHDAAAWLKKEFGEKIWFWPPSDRFYKGLPEFVMCLDGHFVSCELKLRDTYNPQPLQIVNANKIKKANGFHFYARTMKEFKEKMNIISIWVHK